MVQHFMNCNRIKPAPHIIKGKKDIPPGQISMTQITLYLPGKVLPVAFFAHSAAMFQIFKPHSDKESAARTKYPQSLLPILTAPNLPF